MCVARHGTQRYTLRDPITWADGQAQRPERQRWRGHFSPCTGSVSLTEDDTRVPPAVPGNGGADDCGGAGAAGVRRAVFARCLNVTPLT